MSADTVPPPSLITRNSRPIVGLVVALGLIATVLLNVVPTLEPAYQNDALHVAKETAAALVLMLVAALLIGRFRRSGRVVDLLALAGVGTLAVKTISFSVATAILAETSGGLTTWRTTGAGMLGAALLAASALSPERVVMDRRRALFATAAGCVTALGLLMVVASVFELPAAFTDPPESLADVRRLSQDPALLFVDLGATGLFLIAGVAFAQRAEREQDELWLWLAIGSAIAGIGYLNYSLFPSPFTDFIYTGDLFRIAAIIAWGIGTVRVIAQYQDAYAESAVLDERRRVARDLHDGVAQELSFISSQMHSLTKEVRGAGASGRVEESTDQIMEAVQRALDESRGAISALSHSAHEPIHVMLTHVAHEVADRLGTRLELDLDSHVSVTPAWEEALARVTREAIANAVRHGHARSVSVNLHNGDAIWLRVIDDGDGFDPTQAPHSDSSFGLISMKERTETLGGEFRVSSQPGGGTCVEILLP